MLRLVAPSDSLLERVLVDARAAEPSYPEVGATRDAEPFAGYRIDRYERRLGVADGVFDRAVEVVRRWQAQSGAGIRIYPGGAAVEYGGTVLSSSGRSDFGQYSGAGSSTSAKTTRGSASATGRCRGISSAARSR